MCVIAVMYIYNIYDIKYNMILNIYIYHICVYVYVYTL